MSFFFWTSAAEWAWGLTTNSGTEMHQQLITHTIGPGVKANNMQVGHMATRPDTNTVAMATITTASFRERMEAPHVPHG